MDGQRAILVDVRSNVVGPQELLFALPDGFWKASPNTRQALFAVEVDGTIALVSSARPRGREWIPDVAAAAIDSIRFGP